VLPQVSPFGSGSLAAGYLTPLGWFGGVISAVGNLSLASQSQNWAHQIATFRVTMYRAVCML
jgi:hypothetical protein